MGAFTVGDVVVVAFPYADFSRLKKRPAVIIGEAEFDNLILCQVTSRSNTSTRATPLTNADFSQGGLVLDSYVRPDKIFTVEPSVIAGQVGTLRDTAISNIRSQVRQLFA